MNGLVRRILLVDDEEQDVLQMKSALRRADIVCGVVWSRNGRQAIEVLSECSRNEATLGGWFPDLIFVSVDMPRICEAKLLTWILEHQRAPRTPTLVVLIGSTSKALENARARQLLAHETALKPITTSRLEHLAAAYGFRWAKTDDVKAATGRIVGMV